MGSDGFSMERPHRLSLKKMSKSGPPKQNRAVFFIGAP